MTQRKKKLLVDFDGVWTDVAPQAHKLKELRPQILERITGISADECEKVIAKIEKIVLETPTNFGWISEGRPSTFADEDPFLLHNAIFMALSLSEISENLEFKDFISRLDEGAKKQNLDINKIGEIIFMESSEAFIKENGKHALFPYAKEVLHELSHKVDLVFCSNFTADKIKHTLDEINLRDYKLRGQAQKHKLTTNPELFSINGRNFSVDRYIYEEIIREEKPDGVIGDVFSLDLSLPYFLSKTDLNFKDLKIIYAIRDHSPSWSINFNDIIKIKDLRDILYIF